MFSGFFRRELKNQLNAVALTSFTTGLVAELTNSLLITNKIAGIFAGFTATFWSNSFRLNTITFSDLIPSVATAYLQQWLVLNATPYFEGDHQAAHRFIALYLTCTAAGLAVGITPAPVVPVAVALPNADPQIRHKRPK